VKVDEVEITAEAVEYHLKTCFGMEMDYIEILQSKIEKLKPILQTGHTIYCDPRTISKERLLLRTISPKPSARQNMNYHP